MAKDTRSNEYCVERRRIERRIWFIPIASFLLPIGITAALFLRDHQMLDGKSFGWAVLALTATAIFLVSAIGFSTHGILARLDGRSKSQNPARPPGSSRV